MVEGMNDNLNFNFETYKKESIKTDLSVGSFQKLIGIDAEIVNLFKVKDVKNELNILIDKQIDDCFKLLKERNKKLKLGIANVNIFQSERGKYFSFKNNKTAKEEVKNLINDLAKTNLAIKSISLGIIYDE
jgi:hypothetical protein